MSAAGSWAAGLLERKMRMEKKRKKSEKGSLTVEALVFLIPFIMAFCTIINAARFVQAEMLIHHAITQTAKQVSTYSYVLTKAEIAQRMQATNGKSQEFTNDMNEAMTSISGLADAVGDPEAMAEGAFSVVKSGVAQEVTSAAIGKLAKDSIEKSIKNLTDDPDKFLENLGIVGGLSGLDFSESKWISNDAGGKGNVKIVVTYMMKNVIFPDFDFGQYEFYQCASTLIW